MRITKSFAIPFALVAALQTVATDVLADPPATNASQTSASPPEPTGEWGFIVVASGIVAGGALTTYGLTFDCGDAARACQREASIAIWGGIGIASLSSAIGIAIVQMGRARVQATATGLSMTGVF